MKLGPSLRPEELADRAMERRGGRRTLTFMTGKLCVPENRLEIECAILDISDGGACILVPNAAAVPTEFVLKIDRKEATYSCRLAWKSRHRLGVTFQAPPASDFSNSPAFDQLGRTRRSGDS
jgi:PilZ domain